jgi:hypothetical protein
MRSKLALGLLVLTMAAIAAAPVRAQEDSWLHIRVVDREGDAEQVRINLPLKLIESLIPLINTGDDRGDVHLSNGRIHFDCKDLEDIDLRALLEAVRGAEDAEYVTVQGRHENVRVAKEKGDLVINADNQDEHEHVRVRMRMNIVEAMLKADKDELDLVAMVQALRDQGEGELVSVESDEETVRIWIDKKSSE